MRSFVRSILFSLLAACSVAGELSFTVTAERGGEEVDASDLNIVRIPSRQHSRQGPATNEDEKRNTISYSGNWCGASQHAANASDQIVNAFGSFTAPDLTLRPGLPAPQFAAAWVGIDGASCKSTLLQAGVTTVINSNGGQSASAWWEWFPDAAFKISGLTIKPGDWMSVNITTSSLTTAKVVITNASRGVVVTINISNGSKLCRADVEWILEDFYDIEGQVAFAKFSDVWFLDTSATTARGKHIGIDGAAMVYLQSTSGAVTCMAEQYDDSSFVVYSP
ncbi:peptidase A4 family-domain-containing protein [Apodospora peruviana]|uniref:Peptidase A4 family-domain-containing protein n=1 Tax=Apodospora peruviana TaxID=516989 RepID=A0AAE0MGB0_9PEZI|nr:peptidase A4 family-domain-containing protein [Apodospora peruviana]